MEQRTAVSRIRRVLGSNARWQLNHRGARDAGERAAAEAAIAEAEQRLAAIEEAHHDRMADLSRTDPTCRRLTAERAAVLQQMDDLRDARAHRIVVGLENPDAGYITLIAACDTWDEAVEQVETRIPFDLLNDYVPHTRGPWLGGQSDAVN